MSQAPSNRVLNKLVTIVRKVDCDDEGASGSGGEEDVRARIRPMSEQDLTALGFDVSQRRARAWFRDNLELVKGDRIYYTDAGGNTRYVRVDSPWEDAAGEGRAFSCHGPDLVDE